MSVEEDGQITCRPIVLPGLLMLAVLAGYIGVFVTFDAQMGLYKLSKMFAEHDYRQYLGMSKRYLPQYAHMLFLFSI